MKVIKTENAIISLENVRVVEKYPSHSLISVKDLDNRTEDLTADSEEELDEMFDEIFTILERAEVY